MKKYVITGSTSGIGKALLEHFSKDNIVFAGYRNEEYLDYLKCFDNVFPFYIDMEKTETIRQASEFIKSKTNKIDTLLNVAGFVAAGVMEKIDIDKVKKQFQVNTFSHLDFTQRLVSILKSAKVINISSMASFGIFPFIAPYCASKRAMDILFNSMMLESGVQVVSVKPGVIATPLWEKSIELNQDAIKKSTGYEQEMKYMVKSARQNGQKGLNTERVVNLIAKIDRMKNPKPSYTAGCDAYFAQIISRLPFDIQNKLIKLGLKRKLRSFI